MWEQIRANRRRSAVLITGMAIVLLLLGGLAGSALFGPDGAVIGIGIALILWGVQLAVYATNADALSALSLGPLHGGRGGGGWVGRHCRWVG